MDKNIYMEEARRLAAQCWGDPETEGRIMDTPLAEAFAKRLVIWMYTAAQTQEKAEYYRGLLDQCASSLGEHAYVTEIGPSMGNVIYDKIPKLVEISCAVE